MRYGCLTTGRVRDLSPEQVRIGIEISAQGKYESRLAYSTSRDWEAAADKVRTEENHYPKDEEIRPAADGIYQQRVMQAVLHDCRMAISQLMRNGNPHPSEEQIREMMNWLFQAEKKRLQDKDWLDAEREAKETGRVWVPT